MPSPTLSDHLHRLELPPETIAAWLNDSARPVDDGPLFRPAWWKDTSQLKAVCQQMGYADAIHDAFAQASAEIDIGDRAWWSLLNLASLSYSQAHRIRRHEAYMRPGPPASRWGMLADMFKPLALLTALPGMIACHQRMGIDLQITRDTADDLPLWMNEHHRKFGRWGTCDSQGWFGNHLACDLFALGRLQFELSRFSLEYTILISDQKQTAAMVTADQLIRADGLFASCDRDSAQAASDNWTTTFTQTPEGFTGHLVDAQGFIRRDVVTLPASTWRVLARKDDDVIAIHIPARGRLDIPACEASLDQAGRFFASHFPHHRPRLFTCSSWMMDPQLAHLQQGRTNLGRFVKLFQPLPYPHGNDGQMFERVFDNQTDIATLPRDTSLRRDIIAHIEAGGRWRSASGYRLIQ